VGPRVGGPIDGGGIVLSRSETRNRYFLYQLYSVAFTFGNCTIGTPP